MPHGAKKRVEKDPLDSVRRDYKILGLDIHIEREFNNKYYIFSDDHELMTLVEKLEKLELLSKTIGIHLK